VSHAPCVTARTWAPAPPAWSDDPRWYTERMTLDGEEWFARIRPGTDPALPPVVMVHGLIVSGSYFRPVANEMDPRYTVYIPDLPGVGRARSGRYWSLPSFVTHLASWMEAHGLADAIVVGNSLGCQVATLLAGTWPDLVRALVLIGPTMDPAITNVAQLLWRGLRDIPREHPSIWKVWIPDFFRAGPRRSMSMLVEMFRDDQLARLGNLAQPVLVVGGERDPIIPPGWVRDMASRIPRGEAIIVPGAPHALNYSSPRDLVNAVDRAASDGHLPAP
jgi:2-hydroxy-6-oxonona-2,4-dienedioate hydrolase